MLMLMLTLRTGAGQGRAEGAGDGAGCQGCRRHDARGESRQRPMAPFFISTALTRCVQPYLRSSSTQALQSKILTRIKSVVLHDCTITIFLLLFCFLQSFSFSFRRQTSFVCLPPDADHFSQRRPLRSCFDPSIHWRFLFLGSCPLACRGAMLIAPSYRCSGSDYAVPA